MAGAAMLEGEAQDTEIAFDDPRFGPRRFEFEFRPLHDGEDVVGVLVRSTESTHRRMQARTLRLQSRLLEGMTDAVLVVDGQRVIRYANRACEALFGWQSAALIGEPVRALGSAFAAYLEGASQSAAEEAPGPSVTLTLNAPGVAPARVVRCRTSALQFDGQRHDLVLLDDVTERHRLEQDVVEAETRERERLARDVHDNLGQELTSVALMLRTLELELQRGSLPTAESAASRIVPIVQAVNDLVRGTSEMARGIFARPATERGLPEALRDLVQRTSQRSGVSIDCRLELPRGHRLAPMQADHLFRIAQEAITNALRHAHPNHILVELALDAGVLRLTIRDDGRGMAGPRDGAGLGLRIMKFRANAAGGELRVEPDKPRGTRVEYRAALPRSAEPN
jgi:PAS domain S-box-containing protein